MTRPCSTRVGGGECLRRGGIGEEQQRLLRRIADRTTQQQIAPPRGRPGGGEMRVAIFGATRQIVGRERITEQPMRHQSANSSTGVSISFFIACTKLAASQPSTTRWSQEMDRFISLARTISSP